MPSYGQAVAMQREREAYWNRRFHRGFIAVHPTDGIFLGVDRKSGEAVFTPLKDIKLSGQRIPAFYHQEYIRDGACADPRILECTAYRVRVGDHAREAAFAGEVRNLDGSIRTAGGAGPDHYLPRKPRNDFMKAVSVAELRMRRATLLPGDKNRYYNEPLRRPPGAASLAYSSAIAVALIAVPFAVLTAFAVAASNKPDGREKPAPAHQDVAPAKAAPSSSSGVPLFLPF
jgi:hypothetical protein